MRIKGVPEPPLFRLVYHTPTFQDTGKEFAVIRGDLQSTLKLFSAGPGLCSGPHQRIHVSSQWPGAPSSPLMNWYPHFLDQSYTPVHDS